MFQSYLKIAWRNIWRNKAFSITNLLGLTIGMTCTTLILLWVQDERSWDQFHANHKDIYKVLVNRDFNGEITTDIATPFPLDAGLKTAFPEIKNATIDDFGADHVLKYNETIVKKRGYTTNSGFLNLFQWKFVKGNAASAFSNPENIIITESTAKALFGNEEPVGKILKVDNQALKTVSAVLQDPPANSTFQFSFLTSFNPNGGFEKQAANDWINSGTEAYVEVQPGTDIAALNKKMSAFVNAKNNNSPKFDFFLHPMDKWRLYSDFKHGINTGGLISYVKLFTVIAIIILIIACVNFMNLSTAKSEKRSKEVGIRKTLGSERKQLVWQFYSESLIFALLSFFLSVLAVYALLPLFNALVEKQLSLNVFDPVFLGMSVVMIFFTGLVAGSYPALYLSSFNPVKVLKGTFLPGKNAALPRKVLVVLQFGISVLLISSTILVYQQIQHVKNRDLGYNPANLIQIPSSADANKNAEVIKNELLQSGMVASITRTSSPITAIWNFSPAPDWKGKPQGSNLIMTAMQADVSFANTTRTRVIQGRDFTNAPVDSNAMLLNKSAVKIMQLTDPVGMSMRYGNRDYNVVGVTDDVVMGSPYAPVMPMMMFLEKSRGSFYVLRLRDGVKPQAALPKIESVFKQYNPEYPFEYTFVDQDFGRKFATEDLISKLSKIFAGLAIFICCLGLSGLASFTIERRFKEIGIRKVLGASVQQLLYLISREFLFLVLLAALISIPITWWLLHNWLQNYEYHIGISIWLFVGSCLSVLLLTMVIVWLNGLRAALANPAKSLRTE